MFNLGSFPLSEMCSSVLPPFCLTQIWYKSLQLISQSVWTWFAMIIADSSMITRMSRDDENVCKNQRWPPNIRGVEFQRVGRTLFIKSNMLPFPYTLIIPIISTRLKLPIQIKRILNLKYSLIAFAKPNLSPKYVLHQQLLFI